MQISVRKDSETLVVSVQGRMDTLSAPEFDSKMEGLFGQGEKKVVLDFGKLEYVSSAGLRSILVAAKKAKAAGGSVCCCDLQSMVKKVFDLSGFAAMVPVFDSVEEALSR
ncbi:MAG: STAS domain-containing protein [Desulfomonile tiedjei]|nr:STAS domain-containing protein [Desulfomonile tiedjei]